jgi:Zn-dependent M28 family amino/carboxypeptidase
MDAKSMIVQDCMAAMGERWIDGNLYDWLRETPVACAVPALRRVALVAAYGMPAYVFVSEVAALREVFGELGSVWTTEAAETELGAWYVNQDGTRAGIVKIWGEREPGAWYVVNQDGTRVGIVKIGGELEGVHFQLTEVK